MPKYSEVKKYLIYSHLYEKPFSVEAQLPLDDKGEQIHGVIKFHGENAEIARNAMCTPNCQGIMLEADNEAHQPMASDKESVARYIYEAMQWAVRNAENGRFPPDWQEHGNSFAQERAREAAENIFAQPLWQPIDTAPKDGTKVDLWVVFTPAPGNKTYTAWSMRVVDGFYRDGKWMKHNDEEGDSFPVESQWAAGKEVATHWMMVIGPGGEKA